MRTSPTPDFEKLLDYRSQVELSLRAPRTRDSYAFSWRRFVDWCGRAKFCPFPASAETVILYFADSLMNGCKIESCKIYRAAINYMHKSANIPIPEPVEVGQFLVSAQRLRQERPAQKKPLHVDELRQICGQLFLSKRPIDIRNRALLLLAFSSALRRSNIVALDLEDLVWESRGLVVVVRRSKVDQMGKGQLIGVVPGEHPETDPVSAVRQWIAIRGDQPGPLFWSSHYPHARLRGAHVAAILKAAIRGIGGDPRQYGGHSLRSGFATSALGNDANELAVMRTTGHRSLTMLNRYLREKDPFRANASSMIGL
jgi:integrase